MESHQGPDHRKLKYLTRASGLVRRREPLLGLKQENDMVIYVSQITLFGMAL